MSHIDSEQFLPASMSSPVSHDESDAAAVGRPLGAQVLGWTFAQTLRAMYASWRKNLQELAVLDELHERGEPHIISFWHRKYVALFPLLRRRQICVVTTNSPHGHVVASICRFFGNVVIQIPSQGQGQQSLEMIGHAFAHSSEAGMAADGPTGPYQKVKRGPIQVASELGYSIVPVSVASRRKHILHHRWDRLEIPMIFTRVHVSVGRAIKIPPALSWEGVQDWRIRLHDALEAIDTEAERRVRCP
jgi:lysophospholipid acyltransferase (LPLAT)-like uncharacterized protein